MIYLEEKKLNAPLIINRVEGCCSVCHKAVIRMTQGSDVIVLLFSAVMLLSQLG